MSSLPRQLDSISKQSNSRFDLWKDFINANAINRISEIGVYRGEFAEHILRECESVLSYVMIDPWRHLDEWNKPANKDDSTFETFFQETVTRTSFAREKISIYRQTTLNATGNIADNSLDFAYIDGDHTLRGITIDLNCIYNKVSHQGFIAGDDFCQSIWQHSNQYEPTMVFPYAILFAEAKGDHIYSLPFNQFLIQKQPQHDFRRFDLCNGYTSVDLLRHVKPRSVDHEKSGRNLLRLLRRKLAFK